MVTSNDPLEFELWTTEKHVARVGIDVKAQVCKCVAGWISLCEKGVRVMWDGFVWRDEASLVQNYWSMMQWKKRSPGTELESGTDLFGGCPNDSSTKTTLWTDGTDGTVFQYYLYIHLLTI